MCPPPSQRPSGQFAALPSAQRGPLKTMSEEVCLSLLLGTRPCTCLWEMAQSLWHSLRHQEAGLGYLVLTYSHCLPEQGSFPGWWGSRCFFRAGGAMLESWGRGGVTCQQRVPAAGSSLPFPPQSFIPTQGWVCRKQGFCLARSDLWPAPVHQPAWHPEGWMRLSSFPGLQTSFLPSPTPHTAAAGAQGLPSVQGPSQDPSYNFY